MATVIESTDEVSEAVIISGPRKGEFIAVSRTGEEVITPEAEALLEQAIAAAWQMAESAKEARAAAEALRTEVRESNQKLSELLRTTR